MQHLGFWIRICMPYPLSWGGEGGSRFDSVSFAVSLKQTKKNVKDNIWRIKPKKDRTSYEQIYRYRFLPLCNHHIIIRTLLPKFHLYKLKWCSVFWGGRGGMETRFNLSWIKPMDFITLAMSERLSVWVCAEVDLEYCHVLFGSFFFFS